MNDKNGRLVIILGFIVVMMYLIGGFILVLVDYLVSLGLLV